MPTKTTEIPAIIDEAKAAGCENDLMIIGYLAGEVSRLRSMESALASARDELKPVIEYVQAIKNHVPIDVVVSALRVHAAVVSS